MVQRRSQLIDTCPATQRMRLLAVCVIREATGKNKRKPWGGSLNEWPWYKTIFIVTCYGVVFCVCFNHLETLVTLLFFSFKLDSVYWVEFFFWISKLLFFSPLYFFFLILGLILCSFINLPNNSRMWHLFVYFWPLYEMVVERAKSNGTMRVTVNQSGIKELSGSRRFIPKVHQDLACLIKCAALDPA